MRGGTSFYGIELEIREASEREQRRHATEKQPMRALEHDIAEAAEAKVRHRAPKVNKGSEK